MQRMRSRASATQELVCFVCVCKPQTWCHVIKTPKGSGSGQPQSSPNNVEGEEVWSVEALPLMVVRDQPICDHHNYWGRLTVSF